MMNRLFHVATKRVVPTLATTLSRSSIFIFRTHLNVSQQQQQQQNFVRRFRFKNISVGISFKQRFGHSCKKNFSTKSSKKVGTLHSEKQVGPLKRIQQRLNGIPKSIRVIFRTGRVLFLCYILYNLGYSAGMAEYATNPEAHRQSIARKILSQFCPEGEKVENLIVHGSTELRVARILDQIIKGAVRTLDRLSKQATSTEEKTRLETAKNRLNRKWTLIVVDSPAINAFVAPLLPGSIFVLTGLVADFSDDEIAMVCAHELSHALLDHGKNHFNSAAAVTALEIAVLTALDPTGVLTLLLEAFLGPATEYLIELPFSRLQESEADELGINIVADSCFNLEKAISFFGKLQILRDQNGVSNSSWTSTHPLPKERLQILTKMIQEPNIVALDSVCQNVKDALAGSGMWSLFGYGKSTN